MVLQEIAAYAKHYTLHTTAGCSGEGASPVFCYFPSLVYVCEAGALLPLKCFLLCLKTKPNVFQTNWGGGVSHGNSTVGEIAKIGEANKLQVQITLECDFSNIVHFLHI